MPSLQLSAERKRPVRRQQEAHPVRVGGHLRLRLCWLWPRRFCGMALGQLPLKPSPRACDRGRVYGDCPYHCPQFACGGHTYTEVRGAKERVYTGSATNEQRLRCLTSALKSASLACVLRIDVWECAEDEARRRRSREPKTKGGLGSGRKPHRPQAAQAASHRHRAPSTYIYGFIREFPKGRVTAQISLVISLVGQCDARWPIKNPAPSAARAGAPI